MKTLPSALKSVVAGLALLGAGTTALHAGSDTWSGAGANSNWGTAGNWSSASAHLPPVSGDSLIFTGTTRLTANNNLSSFSFGGLTFSSAAGPFTLTGNSLTLTGSLVDNSPNQETINLPLSLNTSQNITVAGGGSLVIGGVISGAGQIINNGLGTLTLDGNNTYLGSTVVSSGTLAGVGSLNGPVIVGPAGNLGAGDASGIGVLILQNTPLTLSGNATLRISKTGGAAVSDNISGISLATYGGTLTISNITSDGTPLVVGDTFPLFSAITGTSNFTSIVGSPGTSLAYYFDPTNGVLGVEPAIGGGSGSGTDNFLAVSTLGGSTIGVYFGLTLDPASASNVTNYLVYAPNSTTPISITNAVVQGDNESVALYLASPVPEFFAVAVSNVFDVTGDTLVDGRTVGYASEYTNTSVGTIGDPAPVGTVFSALPQVFNVTASGSGIGGTNDHCQFIWQQVIGDFDVSVLVTNFDNALTNAVAGLMVRDSLATGSPMALLDFTPASGLDQIQTSGRSATSAATSQFTTSYPGISAYQWLRINRTGMNLTAYFGPDGVNWNLITNAFPLVLNSNLYVGLTLTSGTNGYVTSASFNQFDVTGTRPGDSVIPTVSTAIYQATNLVVRWPITPRDYAVIVSTNLATSVTNSSTGPQWSFLSLPIFDSTLTGTNSAMPTLGRYLLVPQNLFSNNTLFFSLERVVKVIPNIAPTTISTILPHGVRPNGSSPSMPTTTGIISSQSVSNLASSSASTLCGMSVLKGTAVATTGKGCVCVSGYTYQFTTLQDASNPVDLQVTPYGSLTALNSPSTYGVPIANSVEYEVQVTPTSVTNYVFVAAALANGGTKGAITVYQNLISK